MNAMKSQKVTLATLSKSCLLGLMLVGLLGCATAGYKKSDAAAHSLQTASREVTAESRALELTLHTLNDLVNQPGADLKPQFKRFSTALDKLLAASDRNERSEREIAKKSEAYFQAWDEEMATMNYEVVRSNSQARKAQATNDFHNVHQRYVEAQTAMRPLLSYLVDIRKALSADLTQKGLDSIKPIVKNAEENSAKVQLALGRLTNELNASGSRLASYAYQSAQAQGSQAGSK